MTVCKSSIFINDMLFYAFHGVLPQERRVGGEYSVSLTLHTDISEAMQTDCVADTVNYAEVYSIVRQEMDIPSQLLEHVAGRIGRRLLGTFPTVDALELSLTKLNPPMGADCKGAGVRLFLRNDNNG